MNPLFKRVDHVALIVNNLDETLKTYCDKLGFALQERMVVPEQMVEAAFLDAGNSTIELLSPTDVESGSAKFLANRGEGTHHICLEVDNLAATLTALKEQGVRLIDEVARQGPHGLVAFVHPKATHGMMIELLQKAHH